MSFLPSSLTIDSFYPNTQASLYMGNGHTNFSGLSDIQYEWVVDTSNNLNLYGQASGPSPLTNPISISANGTVSIPSLDVSGSDVLSLTSGIGSGINCTGTTNVSLSSNFVAGDNITLVPSTIDNSILISASGGASTVDISANVGSGITVNNSNPLAPILSTNLIAGSNITLVPSVLDNSITINAGGGIISVNGGVAISIDNTIPSAPVINNSGVVGITGGTNVTITGTATNPIINASGTLGVDSVSTSTGSGISIGGTSTDPAVITNLVGSNHIIITPSVVDTSLTISHDLKVPTVFVQYLAPPLPAGAVQLGYQTILGTANQYFTLTAGFWQISLSGYITFNSSTSSPALNFTLQQQTSNTVITAWNVQCHNAFYQVNFNMPSQIFTTSNLILGLYINTPSGTPLAQSVSNLNISCIYIGATQDPLSSGLPYY
jgi:hypothetical protein